SIASRPCSAISRAAPRTVLGARYVNAGSLIIVAGASRPASTQGGLTPARRLRRGVFIALPSRAPACCSRAPWWPEGGLRQARRGSAAAFSSRYLLGPPLVVRGPRGGLRVAEDKASSRSAPRGARL